MMIDSWNLLKIHGEIGHVRGYIKGVMFRYNYKAKPTVQTTDINLDLTHISEMLEKMANSLSEIADGKDER